MSVKIWAGYKDYYKGQQVEYQGKTYIVNQSHSSKADFDKNKFTKLSKEHIEVTKLKCIAMSSMSKEYYEASGKVMAQSFKRNFSHIGPLYVYNEGGFNIKVKTIQSAGWDLGPEYLKFMHRHKNSKVKTFAKKAFPIIDAMNNVDCDRLIWIDADCVIKNNFPYQLLEFISPDDVLSTHFSVWHTKDNIEYHSCETGFFILNKNHPGFEEFKRTYSEIYFYDKTEGLRRYYDGEVYGKTVELMEAKGHKMLNLNPGRHKTPISRSVVAPYITHYKAGLKERVDFTQFDFNDEDVLIDNEED